MPLLSSIDIDGKIRIRITDANNNEVKDVLLNIFDRRSATILPSFGELFFNLFPNGVVSGKDTQQVTTGFFASVYDVGTSLVAVTDIGTESKIDKYETETNLVFKASGSKQNVNITSQTFLYSVTIRYKGINQDEEAVIYDIVHSTILGNCVFAELPNPNATRRGIKVASGQKLNVSFELVISILK